MPRFSRVLFWAATVFTFVMASLPRPPRLPGAPSDKIQHIIAFLTLGALAAWAYPRVSVRRLAVALSCFGVLIEVVQAIPALHRDSSVLDWVADTVAAALVLAVVELWRRRTARRA